MDTTSPEILIASEVDENVNEPELLLKLRFATNGDSENETSVPNVLVI
jgi:hypothetical protein